jgi:hypothetical protein
MHDPERLLSRLNPVTIDWHNISAATGEMLTSVDISAAMAGLERGPYLLMLYLWSHDDSVAQELQGYLLNATQAYAKKYNWQCKDDLDKLLAFIDLAVDELKYVNICKPCNGTGIKINQHCNTCNGGGVKRKPYSYFAKRCGVKDSNWQKCWESKYQEIYMMISDWNQAGIKYMLKRI